MGRLSNVCAAENYSNRVIVIDHCNYRLGQTTHGVMAVGILRNTKYDQVNTKRTSADAIPVVLHQTLDSRAALTFSFDNRVIVTTDVQ